LHYEFGWRNSTADQGSENYDYLEHRILLRIKWNFDFTPGAPRVFSEPAHVPMDFGMSDSGGSGFQDERIQDLLRQDEAARRGSSCVE
jgi:hypothetical protein